MLRREFLAAIAAAPVKIRPAGPDSFRGRLAERELLRGLTRLGMAESGLTFSLRMEPGAFRNPEAYRIAAEPGGVTLTAAGEQALLYAVFDFLERQGAFFGIDGESYPLEAVRELDLPQPGKPWEASPRFAVRGLLPWPDFLNCITVYNRRGLPRLLRSHAAHALQHVRHARLHRRQPVGGIVSLVRIRRRGPPGIPG